MRIIFQFASLLTVTPSTIGVIDRLNTVLSIDVLVGLLFQGDCILASANLKAIFDWPKEKHVKPYI